MLQLVWYYSYDPITMVIADAVALIQSQDTCDEEHLANI